MSGLIHAHGALFSLWVLLFVMQTSLIATHRVRVHQRVGIAGAVLAAAMIAAGVTLRYRAQQPAWRPRESRL